MRVSTRLFSHALRQGHAASPTSTLHVRHFAKVSMSAIKDLRAKTGTGISDCKAALDEAGGDLDVAYEVLRKKGLASAAKKAGRTAAEGLVVVTRSADLRTGFVIEVNSETDFVSRNEAFVNMVQSIAECAVSQDVSSTEELRSAQLGDARVDDTVTAMVAKMGENITLRRMERITVDEGVIGMYVHNKFAEGVGRLGVLVALQAEGISALDEVDSLAGRLAMHVAAASPRYLDRSSVDMTELEKEREILADEARAAGKKEEFVDKIVTGRLNKFYQEFCLLDQTHMASDEEQPPVINKYLTNKGKALGGKLTATSFVRFACGEGIEKEETDYAAEVAAMASQ